METVDKINRPMDMGDREGTGGSSARQSSLNHKDS